MANSLAELKKALQVEEQALEAQIAPLRAKADAIRNKIQPLEAELTAVTDQIKAIEQPKLASVRQDLAGIARAMGGRVLVNEGPAPTEAK